jgi:hypothetical protein
MRAVEGNLGHSTKERWRELERLCSTCVVGDSSRPSEGNVNKQGVSNHYSPELTTANPNNV